MKYLPNNLKERPGVGGPQSPIFTNADKELSKVKVARRATLRLDVLKSVPQVTVLRIFKYANTNFVHVLLDALFYDEIEKLAGNLNITPDRLINNLLVWVVKKLKKAADKSATPIKELQRAIT